MAKFYYGLKVSIEAESKEEADRILNNPNIIIEDVYYETYL